MTQTEFRAWMGRLGLTLKAAADLLGVTPETIKRRRRGSVEIGRETELACQQLEASHKAPTPAHRA